MRVILQTWYQMQRTTPSLRYVNCGPGHIQYTYTSAYSDFNIRLNVSALLLYISRQFNARYTEFLVLNTEHISQFTLCELWSRPYTTCLQLFIFMPQYSAIGTCAAIVDITTVQCALYCKLWAKYSAYPTVYAMWTVVPAIYKVFTASLTEASIFSCRYHRCYCRYHINSMRVVLQSWCQLQRTCFILRYMICSTGQIQSIYRSAFLCFNIQL
jgi:hypothetical protein